jgi:uncharacterized RmlC-like cupin family protein
MPQIEVARSNELTRGDSTEGIQRDRAFKEEDAVISRSTVLPGVISAWHHHGSRSLYGYLVVGRFRLEYGPNGSQSVDLNPGDFFRVPVGVVHRDVNPDAVVEAVIVNVVIGEGPAVVNVKEP